MVLNFLSRAVGVCENLADVDFHMIKSMRCLRRPALAQAAQVMKQSKIDNFLKNIVKATAATVPPN